MAVIAGAAIAAGGSIISGFMGGKSEAKAAKASAKAQKLSDLFQAYRADVDYKRQLEGRLYKEKAIAGYGDNYKGTQTFKRPEFTDPNTVELVNPYDDPKKAKPKPAPILSRAAA